MGGWQVDKWLKMDRWMDGGCKHTLVVKSDHLRKIGFAYFQSNECLLYAWHKGGGRFETKKQKIRSEPSKKLQSNLEIRQYIIKHKIMWYRLFRENSGGKNKKYTPSKKWNIQGRPYGIRLDLSKSLKGRLGLDKLGGGAISKE